MGVRAQEEVWKAWDREVSCDYHLIEIDCFQHKCYHECLRNKQCLDTSKTPYVAIDERGLVRSIHLFLFSCVH